MSDLLQDTDLAREPVKEPAKRWMLVVLYTKAHKRTGCEPFGPGLRNSLPQTWPTEEAAIAHFDQWMSDPRVRGKKHGIALVGAFPVEGGQ